MALESNGIPREELLRRNAALERQLAEAHATIQALTQAPAGQKPVERALQETQAALLRSEEALRESEARLADFLESTHDYFFALDRDWRILFVNRRYAEILGREPGALVGKNFWQEFPVYRGTAVEEHYRQAMEARVPTHLQVGGFYTSSWYEVSIYPVREGIAVFSTDRTEEKKAEAALRRSEALYRAIARNLPNSALWVVDRELRFLVVEGSTIFRDGTSREELEGHTIAEALQDPLRKTFEERFRHALAGEKMSFETSFQDRVMWAQYVPLLDENGRVQAAMGLAFDITERKEVELKLQDRNQRLALLSEAASELLQNTDPDAMLEWLFHRLSRQLDLEIYLYYRLSEDGNHLELVSQMGIPEAALPMVERLELGQGVCGAVAASRQRLAIMDVQHTRDPLADSIRSAGMAAYACQPLIIHGRLIGTLGFGSRRRTHFTPESLDLMSAVSDLLATAIDRSQDELALKEYARRLERSNRDLQEFAFVASHDLQEPLRKIEAFGEALVRGSPNLDPRQREYLERMRKSAGRMRSMVDGLLQLSRLSTQARPFERVDLSRVADEVLSDLELQVRSSGGQVEVNELTTLEADPLQMRQLLQNLIANALKFQPAGGKPVVRVTARRPAPGLVAIEVADNGIGFEEEHAEHLFQPFQRLVGRMDYEGCGMGLAICRKIAERHGGQISAHSRPGQGSIFTVTLPDKPGKMAVRRD